VVKAAVCVGLTTLSTQCAESLEIWEHQPTGTLRACLVAVQRLFYCYICIVYRGVHNSTDICLGIIQETKYCFLGQEPISVMFSLVAKRRTMNTFGLKGRIVRLCAMEFYCSGHEVM